MQLSVNGYPVMEAVVMAVVMALVLWRRYQTTDPLAGLKPGVYRAHQLPGRDAALAVPAPASRRR